MIDYEFSDGGKKESGIEEIIHTDHDCVIRAISIMINENEKIGDTYSRVFNEMVKREMADKDSIKIPTPKQINDRIDAGLYKRIYEPYLEEINFKKIPLESPITWTFAHQKYGDCMVISTHGKHMVAIKSGKVLDNSDSREYFTLKNLRNIKNLFKRENFYFEHKTNTVYFRDKGNPS